MNDRFWRRLWLHDRRAIAVIGVGSVVASLLWRGVTRPMADTVTYRAAARLLLHGWPQLPDRTPGYPLLLVLTGSVHHSTHLLFAVQLAMHVATVALAIDVARRCGVGRNGRAAIAALLFAPGPMLRVLYEGTEGLSALALTWVFWLVVTPPAGRYRLRRAWMLGLLCGGAALVRPTFVLLFAPVAIAEAVRLRRDRADGQREPTALRASVRAAIPVLVAVTVPAVLLVGSLSIYNGVRFESFGLTPLTPYHLNSRTSTYVEELPLSYEPARSVLIRERDKALLRGESSAPANYIYRARPALARVTGLRGRALDRYVMQIDVELILHNPFGYVDTVKTATVNYANLDSQPAILGLGRGAAQVQEALHLVLLAIFLAAVSLVPGLALAGRVDRRTLVTWVVGAVLCAYSWLISVLVETGTARLRAPSEPILALLLVLSISLARRAVVGRPAQLLT